jgi:hypothetical protein
MHKFKLKCRQPVYKNGIFDYNIQREIILYAKSSDDAESQFNRIYRKDDETMVSVTDFVLRSGREIIAVTEELGELQHNITMTFKDKDGRNYTSTNTVKTPSSVVSTLKYWLESEGQNNVPFKIEVTENLYTDT